MRPTLKYIEAKFEEFNKLFFRGELQPLPIQTSNAKSTLGGIAYKRKKKLLGKEEFYDFKMRISTRLDLEEHEVEDVIIHEMIHYYILSRQLHDTGPHGQIFRKIMNDINLRHGRHITISRRSTPEELNQDLHQKLHYVCISLLPDGRTGVTVSARTRVFQMWRAIPCLYHIKKATWYVSTDPYFNRFPNSIKPRIFVANAQEVNAHLQTARELTNDGHCIMVKRIRDPHVSTDE